MAVAVIGTPSTGSFVASASALNVSHTNPSGGTLLLVAVGHGNFSAEDEVSGVTFDGQTLTSLGGIGDGTWTNIRLWYLLNPHVTTANVVVSVTGAVQQLAACAVSISGADVSGTTFGTPATNAGESATASASVTSATGEFVVGAVMSDAEGGITPTGTAIATVGPVESDTLLGVQSYAGAASVTVQWGQASALWSVIGVSIKPSSGGGTTLTPAQGTPTFTGRVMSLGFTINMPDEA